ncbi:MAG: TolC family protein [Cyclobacteriaceae bacterium]|nr:TolC family protein [Cyclobacteriaceae bacterium]
MKTYITIIFVALVATNGWCQTTLEEYVEFAVNNNPGLKSSYAEFEAAMQRVPQMSSLDDPTFRVSSFGQMVETRTGQQMARFSLEQMFPWFGTLKEQKNAAALNAEASFEFFKSKRNELVLKVKQAYYPLYEIDESIRINEGNLKLLESFKTVAVSRFQNGEGKLSDALRIDIMSNEIKTDITILEEKKRAYTIAFNKLINREESAVVITAPYKKDGMPAIINRDSLSHNPQLEVFRKKVLAAQSQERVAERQSMHKLGLGFEYIITQKRPGITFEDNGKDAYMAMVSVSLPIYRKKYKSVIKESQLMQTSFTEMQNEVENNLIAEFELAQFELTRSRQQVDLFQKQVAQTNQVVNLLTSSYENNGAGFDEILEVERSLLKYQILEVGADKEYSLAIAKMEYLVSN